MNKQRSSTAGLSSVAVVAFIAGLLIIAAVWYVNTRPVEPPEATQLPSTPSGLPPAPEEEAATDQTRLRDSEGGSTKEDWTDTPADAPEPMLDNEESSESDTDQSADAAAAGTYEAYQQDKLALAGEGTVVLFFHANWCPTCRAADANIAENLDSIPDNTHILKVDYDSATELRQRYGVTTQHTFVQVDSDGNELQQWTGSRTLSDILAAL